MCAYELIQIEGFNLKYFEMFVLNCEGFGFKGWRPKFNFHSSCYYYLKKKIGNMIFYES